MTAGLHTFEEGLRAGAVRLDVPGRSIPQVVDRLLDELVDEDRLGSSLRHEASRRLAERESEASTAIGRGVAVPHALMPGLDAPIVCFARLAKPLNLGAPDGRPVHFVFLLLGPESSSELHLEQVVAVARLTSDDRTYATFSLAERPGAVIEGIEDFIRRSRAPEPEVVSRHEADGLVWSGRFAGGLVGDLQRRWPHYVSDFAEGFHTKGLAATLFLFFACMAPAVAFGGLMYQLTGGQIGAIEMIAGTAVGGVIYALFAGQPLTIMGGTGPLLEFTGVLYDQCGALGLPFLPVYAWVGLWTALFVMIIALSDASALIRYCTRFTDEIFALLISLIFVFEAVEDVLHLFGEKDVAPYTALVSLVLAIGTYYIAASLRDFRKSVYLRPQIREFLADFGSVIAISSMVYVAHRLGRSDLPTLVVPDTFSPTTGRPWLVELNVVPTWVMLASALPALLCTVLVYLDQNITSRLVNRPDNRLRKGPAYHLDLAVTSVLLAGCSVFGLPWLVAATVRSLNHVRALATYQESIVDGQVHDNIVHVRETRLTGVGIHLLIGASVALLPLLNRYGIRIPMAVLFGLFLFMGLSSLAGNQFWERLKLWAKEPAFYPRTHYVRRVPLPQVHAFTAVQFACLSVLWMVKTSAWALLFPLVIAVLVPLRLVLSRFFHPTVLQMLDSDEEPEEEMLREAGA